MRLIFLRYIVRTGHTIHNTKLNKRVDPAMYNTHYNPVCNVTHTTVTVGVERLTGNILTYGMYSARF
jgi:hypothetical protein